MTLSKKDIELILKKYLEGEEYEILDCVEKIGGGISAGFLGLPTFVNISFKCKGSIRNIILFIKKIPKNYENIIKVMNVFQREGRVYTELLNKFHDYLPSPFPMCYLYKKDTLVLEDLSEKGFRTVDTYATFDYDECVKAVEAVARLHAGSLLHEALGDVQPSRVVPELGKCLAVAFDTEVGRGYQEASFKAMTSVAKAYLPPDSQEVLKRTFQFMERHVVDYGPSGTYPNVICHFDLWSNNIMFRYDECGKAADCRLVDFQFASYGNPASDLLLLLYLCTSQSLLAQHRDDLVARYWSTLTGLLHSRGVEPPTHEDFKLMLEKAEPLVLCQALSSLHFTQIPAELLEDILADSEGHTRHVQEDRTEVVMKAMEASERFKKRILDLMEQLVEHFRSKNILNC